ncbi:SGNH/GDSL hydrolase family protein [Streptomyces violascens]|uniref:SGNH/GDSL hydrolase family protein n=1 Tax=Streptomyces violascens TaxID=67381 RepID=UPI0036470FEC
MAAVMSRPPSVQAMRVPSPNGRYGPDTDDVVTLALLGDSLAVGVGVHRRQDTPGAQLAQKFSERSGRAVDLRVVARTGTTTGQLRRQVRALAGIRPGVAGIVVGANDVLLPVSLQRSAKRLARIAAQLRAQGWTVTIMPCVDWSIAPGLRFWIRATAARRSRRLASLQWRAAEEAHIDVVSIAVEEFLAMPEEMFSSDGCHPSAQGYDLQITKVVGAMFEDPEPV